ncbi:unnamed protein product [Rotaria magnacalcarata]|uniref:T-box domain-containing protein n=6 Tax=Rotaria magnacalcarata TaxID=392030 RepID=A0A819FBK7_9BILA|nr:unnamed protein product [Rotaria magnacalcarata]CAF2050647.1 unnamed protein product [Rotaria magnacalcarata]CAF2095863.1 unnamed protein product [Rotaria magnacalcarata]CAF3861968.1 unnamed protein product [Rotaria magnacalcarata]CAF3900080.1 unnamed protein product [Rotaria magnacalcarata]
MLDNNNLFQRGTVASSAYASMAAFTAAANMYNSFYPTTATTQNDPVNYFACTEMKREQLDPKVSVKLEGMDLWKSFHSFGTEMIITKNGRRLFPTFRVSVSELDPNMKYMFLLDIVPVDDNRYKYQESAWIVSGKAEPHIYGHYYIHPDSPQCGAQWMKQCVLFNKVKITNNPMQSSNQILINSMHRYIIRLHIVQATDDFSLRTGPLSTFLFDETIFIAVTAYQNDQIKNLKIDNNPFAKGFRELTHGKKNNSKSVKRLQATCASNKLTKYDEKQLLYKNDSSLLSSNSYSPPLHSTTIDSTTSSYINNSIGDHEQNSDAPISNFPSIYQRQFSYNPYQNDPSSVFYNPTYSYLGSSSGSTINFPPYGYYPTSVYSNNNYNAPYF